MSKMSVVLLLLSSVLQAHFQQSASENDIDSKIASLMKQKEESNLKEALEELNEILKNPKPKVRPTPKPADFQKSKDAPEEYDYLIAGGGSAGLLMAYRLSQAQTNQILIVEGGAETTVGMLSKIPALSPYCGLTNFANRASFEPQPNVGLSNKDGRVVIYKGCGLGGSSILNSMGVTKSHVSDYSQWGDGWCFDDITDYFKKSESLNITGKVKPAYHGFDGPIGISDTYKSPLAEAFVSCGLENGYKQIDYTANFEEGFSKIRSNTKNGKRSSSADVFLPTIRSRSNVVIKGGKVIKILIDDNNKAYGLQYARKDGIIYTALARKEILICLGTFHSPALLMNSGIGPKEHLQKFGIKCIQDLPVGKNMHDQYKYIGIGLVVNSSAPGCIDDLINDKTKKNYLEGDGPLTSPQSKEATAFKKINSAKPNVALHFVNKFWAIDKGVVLRENFGFTKKFYRKFFKEAEGKKMCTIIPVLKALSEGQVKLRSNNPFEEPIIIGNYYSNPQDKKNMVDAIKFILHLVKCESFKKFGLEVYGTPVPGCENEKGDSYWYCAIKYFTVSKQACTGTCKMGPANDPTSVVDLNLQVIGIKGLRVADSSVIPTPILGHGATRTVILEKAADLVQTKDGLVVDKVCEKDFVENK